MGAWAATVSESSWDWAVASVGIPGGVAAAGLMSRVAPATPIRALIARSPERRRGRRVGRRAGWGCGMEASRSVDGRDPTVAAFRVGPLADACRRRDAPRTM